MNAKRITAVCFLLSTIAGAAQLLYTIKPWSELSDRDLSPLGRAVLNAGSSNWVHAESSNFIFHASSTGVIEEVAAEAEFAYAKLDDYFGTNDVARKGHVFVVGERRVWERVLSGTDRRDDSLAMQFQNDLFVLKESSSVVNVLRVPHEMVHFKLWQLYGTQVPVWLDEGLAGYIGWKFAVAGHALRGKQLVRAPPTLKKEQVLSLDELTDAKTYPAGVAGAAFYVQAEELVGAIARKIGDDKLAEFVKSVAGDGVAWKDYLRKEYSFADSDFAWLEQQIEKYVSK